MNDGSEWGYFIDQLDEEQWQREHPFFCPWYIYLLFIIVGVVVNWLAWFTNIFDFRLQDNPFILNHLIYIFTFAMSSLFKYLVAPMCGLLALLSLPLFVASLFDKHKAF